MKSRPILFQGDMVRALLNGSKTQTRRIMKPQPRKMPGPKPSPDALDMRWLSWVWQDGKRFPKGAFKWCPYGDPGDRLWVKESIRHIGDGGSEYIADGTYTVADAWPWKKDVLPSIFCPRGLSRITLEITEVRVQRLQEISEEDAIAEGMSPLYPERKFPGPFSAPGVALRDSYGPLVNTYVHGSAIGAYKCLWEKINGFDSWNLNPWIWAISFRRVTA